MRKHFYLAALFALAALAFVSAATADTNITDRPYVRHDGGTDATITTCNSDAPANPNAGERQQNEPTPPSTRSTS